MAKAKQNVLIVDVGGSHVKLIDSNHKEPVKIDSGPEMTPRQMVAAVKKAVAGWKHEVIAMGFPGPVLRNHPTLEPHNLGPGWVAFNYEKAFGCPVRIVNDAAMQALGSYEGGRMLFLGLGTGLGSAIIVEGVLGPLELAHLPYRKGRTYEDYVGLRGLERMGKSKWRQHCINVMTLLKNAMQVEYVAVGGGNARLLKDVPEFVRVGSNADAFEGGFRLWGQYPQA